jgi:tripartite-type tricarboxylate transporter receptor subunit TctC
MKNWKGFALAAFAAVMAQGPLPDARAAESAAAYPSKPIRIMAPFSAGSMTDRLGRIISTHMAADWNQTVIVENRTGANGGIGTAAVAASAPDGYTFAVITSGHIINPNFAPVPYDPIKDFAPIIFLTANPNLLVVHPSLDVKNVAELIKLIQDNPGKLTYATSGAGGSSHITTEHLKYVAHLDIEHVPYRGGSLAIADLIAGHVKILMSTVPTAFPYVKSGMARAIAVSSPKRSPVLPDVPTLVESGYPEVSSFEWWGVLAPANTPLEIRQKLNTEITRIMNLPDVKEALAKEGIAFEGGTIAEFDTFLRSESDKWSKLIKAANIKVQ